MLLFKRENGDHSVTGITETRVGGAISDCARFIDVRLAGQNKRGDVVLGGGERVSIDIDQVDSIIFACGGLGEDRY